MKKSDLQEQLAALYLRMNGYFVSGFIIHAPQGEMNERGEPRRNRTELDALAVRFPYNAEPEREIGPSTYLQISDTLTDILICEVKGGKQSLQFNEELREDPRAVASMLRWIGVFEEQEVESLIGNVMTLLSTQYPNDKESFREYCIPGRNVRIRALFFAPDRDAPVHKNQTRYIYGAELLGYIWSCLCPSQEREECQTRYDFSLWGTYEDIVRYFKRINDQGSGTMEDLYHALQVEE
jgi:hypothetical protein